MTPLGVSILRSIVTKNILLFLLIMLVAVVPLAVRYYQDSRDYEIETLASKMEFFAQRGATWIDGTAVQQLRKVEDRRTAAHDKVLASLRRIEREFGVDNAVLMRRDDDGHYTYVAVGHDGFEIGEPVGIHAQFPATYKATNDTWLAGEMMHSQLFGGRIGDTEYDQFLQINTPLTQNGHVIAILMLNKFANPVAAAVRAKTAKVVALSVALLAAGLMLFAVVSSRLLRPLKELTAAASRVADGDLSVAPAQPRRRDEVGRLAMAFGAMVEGLRQRDFIRDTFGRYVTREVVDELLGSPEGLKLGGEMRVVTILVSDLRGFTTLASRLPPQDVLATLNRYLERMVAVIQRHRGTIDEIQGDGILAFFGAPLSAPDDAVRAVACAIEMQLALRTLDEERRRSARPELSMGIGINTGEVVVGNIGSERRTKYGVVGTPINTAYRIESQTVGGQVLVSQDTYERVKAVARVRHAMVVELKGLEQPLTLHDVVGVAGEYQISLPETSEAVSVPVRPGLPVSCFLIEDKRVSALSVAGLLVRLAEHGADLTLDRPVAIAANLKVLITREEVDGAHEMYVKVVEETDDGIRVVFTAVPPPTKAYLTDLLKLSSAPADPA